MSKTCSNCGFRYNPDDAHFCGKCGNKIGNLFDNWKLYNAFGNTVISNYKLSEYRRYENAVKTSFSARFINWSKKFTKELSDWWKTDGISIAIPTGLFLAGMLLLCGIFFFIKSCSESKPMIARILKEGKYGIGIDEDNLLVPAIYDSISHSSIGNQWILFDKTNNLEGLAYVTDSTAIILVPQFVKIVGRNKAGLSILEKKDSLYNDKTYHVSSKGKIYNNQGYKHIENPSHHTDCWDVNTCLIATKRDGGKQFLDNQGMPVDNMAYYNIIVDPDSMIRATMYDTSKKYKYPGKVTIHDYTGKRISGNDFYRVYPFSDGVAWTYKTKADLKRHIISLIDKSGTTLFSKPNAILCEAFSEGIGWISPGSSSYQYTAVDKTGRELFKINALQAYPFSMGIAPIYKGTTWSDWKLGFVDKSGNIVIPFKYVAKHYNPHFAPDSTIQVSLDGVDGKLHRNGTFTPESYK